MTARNILLFLHIATAIIIVGGITFLDMILPSLVRGGRENLPVLRKLLSVGNVFGPSSAIVFLIGLALVKQSKGIEISDMWVGLSMLLFIVASVIGGVVIGKTLQRAITNIDAGHPADAEASRLGMFGGITILLVLAIVYLMVVKPT